MSLNDPYVNTWGPCLVASEKAGWRLLWGGGLPAPALPPALKLPRWGGKISIRLHICHVSMVREVGDCFTVAVLA